jgi:hypothetical protein
LVEGQTAPVAEAVVLSLLLLLLLLLLPMLLQVLTLSVRDVAEPLPLALPRYGGELYVYVALVLGGVWMFSTVPLIVMFGVVLVSASRLSFMMPCSNSCYVQCEP